MQPDFRQLLYSLLFKAVFTTFFYLLFLASLFAQDQFKNNRENYVINVKKTTEQLRVDGLLDEAPWQEAQVAKDFYRVLPIDTGFAQSPTEVMVTYNDKTLYFGIRCIETMPGDNVIESLRRDFSFGGNDNFLLFIDTFNDQTNGFSFGASAGGAQWDGLQSDGGNVSLDWDCKWEMTVKHYDGYWIIEMAIPFRNLQFKEGLETWGVNFSRLDLKRNEKSSWAPVPRQFPTASLAFTGTLAWETPPQKRKTNVSIIPYVLGGVSKDYTEEGSETQYRGDAGVDAQITLSSSLNLDLTVNPDFSQVDVDEQVTNLDRFELFFPERRRFFLQNADLFTGFGDRGLRPFFSRRIGLKNPVIAGARLSGKIDEKWRIGLLNMQTGTKDSIPAANFTVASVQKQIFSRSNIGVFFVNKQLTTTDEEIKEKEDVSEYNRVVGIDYNLASADNQMQGKFFVHKSITPEDDDKGYAIGSNLSYRTQRLRIQGEYTLVGQDYQANETGFVRRTGFHNFNPSIFYKFYPKSKIIANHGPGVWYSWFLDSDFETTDHTLWTNYSVNFLNRSELDISFTHRYIKLFAPFDPTNTEGDTLATGTDYSWQTIDLDYESAPRSRFTYEVSIEYGGFYNGKRLSLEGEVGYRFQPYGSLSVNVSYDNLQFPAPFQDAAFYLIGPKLDVTFTDKMFLTAFFQYNDQADNINTNIRFQWRYQPVSDLFIVYTDNYLPGNFKVKNRALVVKMSYWFN